MSLGKLRRRVERAVHVFTGEIETWRGIVRAMDRYLGPAIGMSPLERWDRMGELELEQLAEALEERAAIVAEGRS